MSIRLLALLAFAVVTPALGQPDQKTLFVTNNVGSPGSVTSFRVQPDGTLTFVGVYSNVGVNPQDCGVTADGTRLIVLNATASVTTEDIYTARINADSTITVNPVPNTVGDGPLALHITSNDYLLVPSAVTDVLTSYRINFNSLAQINTAFSGGFATKPIARPDNKYAYTIGSSSPDDVVHFSLLPTGHLTYIASTDISGGGGFGAAFHPSGDTLYVSTGLQNLILQYSVDNDTGAISQVAAHSSGGAPNNSAVEIAMHPMGTYLYVCHVVSDTLSVLRVNPDRSLSTMGLTYTVGSDIRDCISDGEFVYVTDESTLSPGVGVIVYRINGDGSLTQLGPPTPTGGTRPQFMALWAPPPPPPSCLGDANGDLLVNFADITATLAQWGGSGPLGDANFDGMVNFADITTELANWGPCPPIR